MASVIDEALLPYVWTWLFFCRYCHRFIPVEETSYANMDDIESMSTRILAPFFQAENQESTTVRGRPFQENI